MKLSLLGGATDQTINVVLLDSSSPVGAGLTGITYGTTGLSAYYVRDRSAATAITLATLASPQAVHTDGGFVEIDSTNMPGVYRLDLPDAVVDAGVNSAVVMLKGAANMAPVWAELQLSRSPADVKAIDGNTTAAVAASAAWLAAVTTYGALPVNVYMISGDTTAADTFEAIIDASTTTAIAANVAKVDGDTTAASTLKTIMDASATNGIAVDATTVWDEPASNYTSTSDTMGHALYRADDNAIATLTQVATWASDGILIDDGEMGNIATEVWGTNMASYTDTAYAGGILNYVKSRTANLSPGSIAVQSPVIGAQSFSLVRGDSYTDTADFDRSVTFTVTTPLNLAHTNANVYGYFDIGSTALLVKQPVVTNTDTNVYDLQFEFTNEETVTWAASGSFDVKCWWNTETTEGDVTTIVIGTLTVSEPTYDGAEGADGV